MRALINTKLVETLKPGPLPYEVRDSKLRGFLLRVQPTGGMSFICEYKRGARFTIGRTAALSATVARIRAQKILAEAVLGVDPMVAKKEKANEHTWSSFVKDEYEAWVLANRKSGDYTLARLKACFSEFNHKKLDEITPWLVEKWRSAEFKRGRKATGINRDLDDLKAALAKAVAWEFLDKHPLGSVRRSKVDRLPKVRFLDQDEESRLRRQLDIRHEHLRRGRESANSWRRERGYPELPAEPSDHLRPIVLLAINTGMRRGELFNLTWDHVDLDRAVLTVAGATAKTGSTRHIPLNAEALSVLSKWRPAEGRLQGHVFPGREGERLDNINKAWHALLNEAGIIDFRFHDLRHHFASALVMAGVDLNTVRELLGHSDIKMTLRYAHLAPQHKAAAVERLIRRSSAELVATPANVSHTEPKAVSQS